MSATWEITVRAENGSAARTSHVDANTAHAAIRHATLAYEREFGKQKVIQAAARKLTPDEQR